MLVCLAVWMCLCMSVWVLMWSAGVFVSVGPCVNGSVGGTCASGSPPLGCSACSHFTGMRAHSTKAAERKNRTKVGTTTALCVCAKVFFCL